MTNEQFEMLKTNAKFIKRLDNTKSLENMRFLITRTMVEGYGLILTDGNETPDEQLNSEQLEIKRMVKEFGYKVRL